MKQLLLLIFLIPLFSFSQTQIGQDIDGENADDLSGYSISLSSDGSIIAIGATENDGNGSNSGDVRVFENQSGSWVQIGQDIDGESEFNRFGISVSLSSDGSIIAIGANRNNGSGTDSGHVRVFENQSGSWVQIGSDIDGEVSNDQSGFSVSLSSDGSIIAIGAIFNDNSNGNNSGHVRVFENISGVWTQIGSDIDGEGLGDESGTSVSLSSDGSIVAIGAPSNDNVNGGGDSGHVRVFENISGVWTQIGQDIDGQVTNDRSGTSVSLSSNGSIVAIGAPEGNSNNSGYVRIFENQSGTWVQIGNDIDGEGFDDRSGTSVSLSSDGSIVAIGAIFNRAPVFREGHVRVYENQSGSWIQIGNDIDGEAFNDESGFSVSISSDGNIVGIGAIANQGNGQNSGHVRVFDLSAVLSSDEFVLSQFNLYPNPAKNKVTIELNQGLELQNINIYNNLGQFISSSKSVEIDTSQLSTGLYYLEIETNKGKASKKLIIE